MKNFSNKYIFLYISALVILIAVVLSVVSIGLKPLREANVQAEKCQQILYAAGYHDVGRKQSVELFSKVAEKMQGSANQEVYRVRCADGADGYAFSLEGKGLWGPIWGYAVTNIDGTILKGVAFDHKSETPGLGAKITEEDFLNSFKGKCLYDKDGRFVSVRVLKPGTSNDVGNENRVDAISGATLTSKGVDKMLTDGLQNLKH